MPDPHSNRGLPPLAAMTRGPPRVETLTLGQPPTLSHLRESQEEPMGNWLLLKVEEAKRKQEEQKTQQESLKLEQRKIEQAMLRESLQSGIPPSMVPMICAVNGGLNLANISLDWIQQYTAQLQITQQQIQQQSSADIHRDRGGLNRPARVACNSAQSQQTLSSQPIEQPQSHSSPTRLATPTQLPRLITNEIIHQPPQPGISSANLHPSSINFHHWIPPTQSKSGNLPQN